MSKAGRTIIAALKSLNRRLASGEPIKAVRVERVGNSITQKKVLLQ